MPVLVAQSGPLAGQRFEFDDEVVLGRENATITLSDAQTSRRHAAIRVVAGTVLIEDLGSTNGTFVDGRRITTTTKLAGGETIKLGQASFYLELEPAPGTDIDAGATRVADLPTPVDADRTTPRAVPAGPEPSPQPEPTRSRKRSAPLEPGVAAPALTPPDAASGGNPVARGPAAPAAPGDLPFAAFSPPEPKRRRGPASRKLGPTLVSFATIITTAVALIVYFAGR